MEKIVISGAGLVGSMHAIRMAQKGLDVEVYERRSDIRNEEIVGGRSINLACSTRAWRALEASGVADEIRAIAIPMYGRKMHGKNGEITFQPYGLEGQAIYSVSRGELNKRLLIKADSFDNVKMFFNHRSKDVDLKTNELFVENDLGETIRIKAGRLFGTDGAYSAVRNRLMRTDRFDYCQTYLKHGYKELLLPANDDGSHKLDKNALHIWPRGHFMLIALPNFDGSFTCTLFIPFEGDVSFKALDTPEKVTAFFQREFPDFLKLMPGVAEEYENHPTSSLVTVKCEPWNYKDRILLLGDAAHAIVPFYGQGMISGFEDTRIFSDMYDEYEGDWSQIIPRFAKHRKPDGDAIADLALQNFIEMRDLVGDEMFLLRKKIEKKIYEKHPDKWMPLYSQVTFSHIRYSEALVAGKRQKAIMDEIMAMKDIKTRWDSDEVEQRILEKIAESQ